VVEAGADPIKRQEFIEKKAHRWGELKDWLLALSHQKCWFSEAKDCCQYWYVEHFRLKASAKNVDGWRPCRQTALTHGTLTHVGNGGQPTHWKS